MDISPAFSSTSTTHTEFPHILHGLIEDVVLLFVAFPIGQIGREGANPLRSACRRCRCRRRPMACQAAVAVLNGVSDQQLASRCQETVLPSPGILQK